ncbi:MAG: protoheme IX farnesyltransferase, partial [Chitinophagia bacterium]|nr:protoheme IX farnesyltransferase [Chitinophagia bacterium]
AKGSITPEGWVLFLFQFFWQFPHFWSIAYIAFEDYERAGIRMLPTRERDSRFTGLQCIYYSLVLIPLSFFAQNMHITGNIGMSVCLVAALLYAVASYRFYTLNTVPSARQVMFASIIYLPVIFLAMLFDKA